MNLYTSNNCKNCKSVKEKLIQNNIEYKECNIEDTKHRINLMKNGFAKVPVIEIDNNFYVAEQWVDDNLN